MLATQVCMRHKSYIVNFKSKSKRNKYVKTLLNIIRNTYVLRITFSLVFVFGTVCLKLCVIIGYCY